MIRSTTSVFRVAPTIAIALSLMAPSVSAQVPDEFTNLQVLPQDIGKRELMSLMRGFAGGLGVRCNYCHLGDDPDSLEGYDFASDEEEAKQVARVMMQMTNKINQEMLPATGRRELTRVECVTCHRGVTDPRPLADILLKVAQARGADAAVSRYEDLHDEYYGTGAYDFSPGTLNGTAEKLARADDVQGAIRLMQLNIEQDPDVAYSHLLLGQFYAAAGDKAAAIASVKRSLELEPDNPWAKRVLGRLESGD